MNVVMFPADRFGCGFYRMRQPAAHAGVPVEVMDRVPLHTERVGYRRALRSIPVEADVAIFQRPLSHHVPAMIETFQRQGTAVVVEIDDDLTALHPKHAVFRDMHPQGAPHANWQHLRTCCRNADLVTVTSDALAKRFAGHGRVAVLPNCVDAELLTISMPRDVDFGWAGHLGSHPDDLRVLGLSVQRLVRDGHSFRVVGPGEGVAQALSLPDVDDTGWLDLQFYYRAAAQLRVGIVPLAESAFNDAKSWLKGLEYAALGVPYCASPRAEYRRLGLGTLCVKPRHWERALRALLTDEALWQEQYWHGRQQVAERHTIETNGWRWAEAWDQAAKNRKTYDSRGARGRRPDLTNAGIPPSRAHD